MCIPESYFQGVGWLLIDTLVTYSTCAGSLNSSIPHCGPTLSYPLKKYQLPAQRTFFVAVNSQEASALDQSGLATPASSLQRISRIRHAFPTLTTRPRSSLPCCRYLVIRYTSKSPCRKSLSHYPHLSAMNDPGLHESANEAAQDVEKNGHEGDGQAERDEQEFLDPRCVCWLRYHDRV